MKRKEKRFTQTLRILHILQFLKSWHNVNEILKFTKRKQYSAEIRTIYRDINLLIQGKYIKSKTKNEFQFFKRISK